MFAGCPDIPRAGSEMARETIADPDFALVCAAKTGDLTAFEELVRRHEAGVFRFLLRMCGEHSTAEELTQATFVRAWEKLGGFEQRAQFRTWLYRIAHHHCINRLTRSRPAEELSEDLPGAPSLEPGGGAPAAAAE